MLLGVPRIHEELLKIGIDVGPDQRGEIHGAEVGTSGAMWTQFVLAAQQI
jgi:hypothetical protein